MEGWIKLHRKLSDNPLWTCEPFTKGQAWVDLILLANHEYNYFYKRGIKIEVQRGQIGISEVGLSDRWKWSRTKVRLFLNQLEKEQQIIQQKCNVTQLVTIINYDYYQQKEQQTIHQKDTKRTPKEHQKDTNKNDKNEENDKNEKKYIEEAYLLNEFSKSLFNEKYVNNNSLDCFDKLIRLDNYTSDQIKKAIRNGKNDAFWNKNFLSPVKLREKDKLQILYIDKFLNLEDHGSTKLTADSKSAIAAGQKDFSWGGWKPGQTS